MGLPPQYEKRQNYFITIFLLPLYTLSHDFVALCKANFLSHSYVRAELEIWPTESYFSDNLKSSNKWLQKNPLQGTEKPNFLQGCALTPDSLLKCSQKSGSFINNSLLKVVNFGPCNTEVSF